jgi:hypothetical protein
VEVRPGNRFCCHCRDKGHIKKNCPKLHLGNFK